MAIFKVLTQRNEARGFAGETDICHFTAFLIEGELVKGMEFIAFETHHPVPLKILSVANGQPYLQLTCKVDWYLYEDQFVGAVFDSSGKKRGVHFFFDHDNKYGPAPLSQA